MNRSFPSINCAGLSRQPARVRNPYSVKVQLTRKEIKESVFITTEWLYDSFLLDKPTG
jgi:hypothetical protein